MVPERLFIAHIKPTQVVPHVCADLWHGDVDIFTSKVNHQGSQVMIGQGDMLKLCELQIGQDTTSLRPLWTQAFVEATHKQSNEVSRIIWSNNDKHVANMVQQA